MDDFLSSVQAFVTKNVCKSHKHMHACVVSHRRGSLFFPITVRCCCTNRTTTKHHPGVVFFVSLWCLMASGHIINLSDLHSVRRVQTRKNSVRFNYEVPTKKNKEPPRTVKTQNQKYWEPPMWILERVRRLATYTAMAKRSGFTVLIACTHLNLASERRPSPH